MGHALFYYELCSRWNRLRTRLRRLRQPKYLVGALVGGLYFYTYFFRGLARRPAAGATMPGWLPEHRGPGGIHRRTGFIGDRAFDVDHSARARCACV